MPENYCRDCRYAKNERPNFATRRREWDCFGLPPNVQLVGSAGGQIGQFKFRVTVDDHDAACSLFKLRLTAEGGGRPAVAAWPPGGTVTTHSAAADEALGSRYAGASLTEEGK